MNRIVQVCPVGFEYDRVLEGIRMNPCNVVYLLRSFKKELVENDPDEKMIEIAGKFVDRLHDHLSVEKTREIIVRDTSIINFERSIRALCEIIKEELEEKQASEIHVNTSTANKMFVAAAMHVASFFPDKVHLFYLRSSFYIMNKIYDESYDKRQMKEKFELCGTTYKKNDASYESVDMPIYPFQKYSRQNQVVLRSLRTFMDEGNEWTSLTNLLKHMGVYEDEVKKNKAVKMKYGHHIKKLKEARLIEEITHGNQKKYALTSAGRILGLIYSFFTF